MDIKQTVMNAATDIEAVSNAQELEAFRIKYLGSKGLVKDMFVALGRLSKEEKPRVGQEINSARNRITELFEDKKKGV